IIARKWRLPDIFVDCITTCTTDSPNHPPRYQDELKLVRCTHELSYGFGFPSPVDQKEHSPEQLL
ncbi:MAG: hypothetical protein GWO08_09805, partial [Gammaproteobacteria bacterium]|nr:hypothetical protein [Gammaproteobacteria bacterium]NIR93950.1 hypothetical protein [Gammaproteobacteria bacterium]